MMFRCHASILFLLLVYALLVRGVLFFGGVRESDASAYAMYGVSADWILRTKGWASITEEPVGYLWLTLTRAFDFWIGSSFYLVSSDQGFGQGFAGDAADRGWLVATYSVAKQLLLIPRLVVLAL